MKRLLFWAARHVVPRRIVGLTFAHLSFALPVARVYETPHLIAFHHPRPSHPLHILIVPKDARARLTDLTAADAPFLVDLLAAVRHLVAAYDLERRGYRLIVNGGPYQDVPQVHFHLITESA